MIAKPITAEMVQAEIKRLREAYPFLIHILTVEIYKIVRPYMEQTQQLSAELEAARCANEELTSRLAGALAQRDSATLFDSSLDLRPRYLFVQIEQQKFSIGWNHKIEKWTVQLPGQVVGNVGEDRDLAIAIYKAIARGIDKNTLAKKI